MTPLIFSSADADVGLAVPHPTFTLVAQGAKRTVDAAGAYTFDFYADSAQGFLVPNDRRYFGWVFDGAACIPYEEPVLAIGEALIPVMEFDYTGGVDYTFAPTAYGPNERWSVQVSNELTQVVPSTAGPGTAALTDCICPSNSKKLASGICQLLCPNGWFMAKDTDSVCSMCTQGSYCVDSTILPCATGFSSVSGSSVCTACAVAGGASDISLYTCGLKNCTKAITQPLGTSNWRGLGKINVGVNQYGSLDDYPFTPWAPGSIVVSMELNPASDRPYALLERDVTVIPNKPNAFQFRYKCAGVACVKSFVVQYKESAGAFVDIFAVDTVPSVNWVQTSTEYFVPSSIFVTVRIVAQLFVSSSKVWLSGIKNRRNGCLGAHQWQQCSTAQHHICVDSVFNRVHGTR